MVEKAQIFFSAQSEPWHWYRWTLKLQ